MFNVFFFFFYQQGQCYCDQGMFFEALESFAKAVELKPGFRPYHMRRFVVWAIFEYCKTVCLF